MKKTIRIITTILLILVILLCSVWYLFVYDRDFTRDILLNCARSSESRGNHTLTAWFYNLAYAQSDNDDSVAIELAQQYKTSGNYTKAEYTLYNAISDGGGIDVYIALSRLYVEQDKLLDAVTMLGSISNEKIKHEIDSLRPVAPVSTPAPGFYNQYITVTINTNGETVYYSTDSEYPSLKNAPYSEPITLKNGENVISALAVNDLGLVSPLATFGYTVGGVVELVDFKDAAIEQELRALIGAGENDEVYTDALWSISEFTIPKEAKVYSDIKHLAFLKKITIDNGNPEELICLSGLSNLTEIHITNTTVSQAVLESIAKLPSLSILTLSNCNLAGISPLYSSSGLTRLDLSNNAIRDISPISAMASLEELYLQHNAIVDLSALSNIKTLNILDVSHNALTTLSPLSALTALTQLNASTNNLTEIKSLGNLTALTKISLASNKLSDINQLSQCKLLADLDLSSNLLTDISSLSVLTNLVTFNFSHNKVDKLAKWDKACSLVTIDGSYNNINSLDPLGGLKNLNIINMDYNADIKSVDSLAECPNLLEVNVYGTAVTDAKKLKAQSVVVNYNPVQ